MEGTRRGGFFGVVSLDRQCWNGRTEAQFSDLLFHHSAFPGVAHARGNRLWQWQARRNTNNLG